MSHLQEAVRLLDQLKALEAQPQPPPQPTKELLDKLKLLVVRFSFPDPNLPDEEKRKQLLLCRESLELGALLSIKLEDIPSFERYMAQVKTFYRDYSSILPESQREYPLLGLNLLRLLAKNKLDEFHVELELIPLEKRSNFYINYPITLEQRMMEGAYRKILRDKDNVPLDSYKFFMNMLLSTVRDEIASCYEKAFHSLSLQEAQNALSLSPEQLAQYAKQRNWRIENGIVFFRLQEKQTKAELPAMTLMRQTLQYARELERIV